MNFLHYQSYTSHLLSNLLIFFSFHLHLFQFQNKSIGGRSYSGINEWIMWATIIMATIIAILITLALCYLAREKYKKRQEYYVNA